MARIAWPAESRIVEMTHELWSPGRIIHRLRDGTIAPPLYRARDRWRGTVTFGAYASTGDDAPRKAAVEAFVAAFSDPNNWCEMPWGRHGANPFYRTKESAWTASVNSPSTIEDGVLRLGRLTGPTALLLRGDWVRSEGLSGVGQVAVVTDVPFVSAEGFDAFGNVVPGRLAGQDQTVHITPPLPFKLRDTVYPARTIRVRMNAPAAAGIPVGRDAGFGGSATLAWEEYTQ